MSRKKTTAAGKKAEGSLTEALGKLTGDKEIEARGASKKREGEAGGTGADPAGPHDPPSADRPPATRR